MATAALSGTEAVAIPVDVDFQSDKVIDLMASGLFILWQ